ncbi:MAG: RNA polymerase sigma-70 factor [Chitinophagaceae bacterium]|nr:RNA polymerase sigma-70 factor [Chitinophagaceae bacterium]
MVHSELHNDKELFLLIAAGDETAFASIFHKYNVQLYPAVLKILKSQAEAEEIVQNTFLKLWLNRHQLPEVDSPGAWLTRIASNLALNALRDKATYHRHTAIAGQSMATEEGEPELHLNARELKNLISEAVELMPAARQQIFKMSRYEGLSRQEIAQQLGLAESTVKNQLTSSLKFIQEYLIKKHGIHLPLIIFLLFY